jgi:hypothetical protein
MRLRGPLAARIDPMAWVPSLRLPPPLPFRHIILQVKPGE